MHDRWKLGPLELQTPQAVDSVRSVVNGRNVDGHRLFASAKNHVANMATGVELLENVGNSRILAGALNTAAGILAHNQMLGVGLVVADSGKMGRMVRKMRLQALTRGYIVGRRERCWAGPCGEQCWNSRLTAG